MAHRIVLTAVVLAIAVGALQAQPVISARSGLILYSHGDIALNGHPLGLSSRYAMLQDGAILRTESGRADILLTPSVFLRLDENSAIRMISGSLLDTRVELLEGSLVVTAGEFRYDNAVSLVYRDRVLGLSARGLYRLDARPEQGEAVLRVNAGQVQVGGSGAAQTAVVAANQRCSLGSGAIEAGLPSPPDALDLWATQRTDVDSQPTVSNDVPKRRRIVRAFSWFRPGGGSSDGTF